MKSRHFYKGSIAEPEGQLFLSPSPAKKVESGKFPIASNTDQFVDTVGNTTRFNNRSKYNRIMATLMKFQSHRAKKAFFIAFTLLILTCPTWMLMGYVTDIFNRSGSSFSEKKSSLLISVTTILANLLFLNIVERFNRKVCYIHRQFWAKNLPINEVFMVGMFGIYAKFWVKISNLIRNLKRTFWFSDAVHLFINYDVNIFLNVCDVLIVLAQTTRIRVDAAAVFCLHHLFQWHGTNAHSIHCRLWNIPERCKQSPKNAFFPLNKKPITKCLYRFRFVIFHWQWLCHRCGSSYLSLVMRFHCFWTLLEYSHWWYYSPFFALWTPFLASFCRKRVANRTMRLWNLWINNHLLPSFVYVWNI